MKRIAAVVCLVACTLLPVAANAQTNWVDPSIGGEPVVVDLGPGNDVATAMAVQRDGKVVVVGTANMYPAAGSGGNSDMAVLRFDPNGRLDPTFGDRGRVLVDNADENDRALAVALQTDGGILVAGSTDVTRWGNTLPQLAVIRLDRAGRPDPGFNGGGLMILGRFAVSEGAAIALQPDGRIVVAGKGMISSEANRGEDMTVFRLAADGTPDGSFGDGGAVIADAGGYRNHEAATSVAVRPDGRIVVAGESYGVPIRPILMQLSSSGVLDPTFGTDGMVFSDAPGGISSAVLRSDGTLVTAGDVTFDRRVTIRSRSVAIRAYAPDGSFDPRFGVVGTTVSHAPPTSRDGVVVSLGNARAGAVTMDARGRLVAAGSTTGYIHGAAAVVRYNGAGALDAGFGRAGWMQTDAPGTLERFNAVGLLPNAAIAAVGDTTVDGQRAILFAVYPSTDRPSPAKAWGWNPVGQVGDGSAVDRTSPVPVAGLSSAAVLSGGVVHSLALDDRGAVHAWGWNGLGLLGDGTTKDRATPAAVPGLTGAAAISAGYFHSLAVQSGTVRTWGWNAYGQLGDGSTVDRARPVTVGGLDRVVAVAGGGLHSLALRGDGTVWAWGWNGAGQLGNGTTSDTRHAVRVGGLEGVVAIAAGAHHSLALTSDGTIYAWGWNVGGQLGNGTTTTATGRRGWRAPGSLPSPVGHTTASPSGTTARCGAGATTDRASWATARCTHACGRCRSAAHRKPTW